MRAEDTRSPERGRHAAQRLDELCLRRRDERRQVRGDTGFEQRVARRRVPVRVGAEKVDPREPVHLQVDETRCGDAAAIGDRKTGGGDAPGDELEIAGDEPAADEGRLDAESHVSSAARIPPPAAASRARAVSTSTPASSETIATFASPPAAASASSACCGSAPVA